MVRSKNKKFINANEFFTSKTNTLNFLQRKLKYSLIEQTYDFTVREWNSNKEKILRDIQTNFDSNIVIRSSAIGEDTNESSHAGVFSSFLNIPVNSLKKIENTINSVIRSYSEKDNVNLQNQILIQNQTQNIISSGVIFSRTPDYGSPYYIINYEEGASTIGVTQGLVNNSIKIYRKINQNTIPKKWKLLLKSVDEIEKLLQNTYLDIEFGIKNDQTIVIFQVRPLTFIKKEKNLDNHVKRLISKHKKQFFEQKTSRNILGSYTIFSDMSDWNPAEIIGNNPNNLDYSLYDYLIMKSAWHKGRSKIGYQKINHSLMIKFGNKPYVDIRASVNSLLPKNMPLKLKKKLVQYYLEQIKNNPVLHDKIEFEVLFSCYDFIIKNRLKNLKKYEFSDKEILEIENSLKDFTNNIINQFPQILKNVKKSIKILTVQREKIESKMEEESLNSKQLIQLASELLKDCITFGTIPFSTIARVAFIGSILLKSLIISSNVNPSIYDQFLNSISTPLSEIQKDLLDYSSGKLSKNIFLSKYGHLRPGTYDITALRYDMNNKFFEEIKFNKLRKVTSKHIINNKKILMEIKRSPLQFEANHFFSFVKSSLEQREYLKFEFTKNLSLALEIIAKAASQLGFLRKDVALLKISNILKIKDHSNKEIIQYWNKKIILNQKNRNLNNLVVLPPLITSKNDFECIKYFKQKPNFVSNKKIKARTINIQKQDIQKCSLENKIVLIESADPGYDWIFTKNLAGLITKYGGIASHMAIRCAELDVPAAIGCGEILFEKLITSSKILLDCNNKEILILENTQVDEEVEIRKVLKSLGYIK